MIVVYHPEALLEYEEAVDFYEDRLVGLGGRLREDVREALKHIAENPLRFPVIAEDVRRCLTPTFPYGILYTVEGETLLMVAIMHLSRSPNYWKQSRR